MSKSKLKKLTIEHLRGSVVPFNLEFNKDKKLTIVYGENGTGKTTICDAFDFIANDNIGSLDGRGLGRTENYWPSLGKNPSDISVLFETANATCVARLRNRNVVAEPADARPKVEVLRRSQILKLLEARPADRYVAISPFIDVAGIETSESTLRELIRNLESSRETAVARVLENQDAIFQFWVTAGKPGANPFLWAEAEVNKDISAAESELKALTGLRVAYQRLVDYPQRLEQANQSLTIENTAYQTAKSQLETTISHAVEGANELVNILEAAKPFLEKHPQPEQCPLCESKEKAADLTASVEQRLKQYEEIQKAKREEIAAKKGVQRSEQTLASLQSQFTQDIEKFRTASAAYKWSENVKLPEDSATVDIQSLSGWLSRSSHLPGEWSNIESRWRDQSQFFNTLKKALETYKTNTQAQKELDILIPRLKQALQIIIDERKKFTDSLLKSIADEVGRLYEVVHPGEGLDKISLQLDPGRRASLDISASFAGQPDTPPQAYFSQSHLDTLGLCVFLALAFMDSPEETILVFDDVLASVDEPHVYRLIEMLYEEAVKFRHCIITTHYKPWKHKLRWGWLQNGQCHFVELTKWTITDGIRMISSVPDIEKLKVLLAEAQPDTQLVCAKAGVILEAILDFLTQLYECHVPRRQNALYTLGDLLPAIDKKLRSSLKIEVISGHDADGKPTYNTIDLGPMLDELTRIAQARNVFGAHFNALSFELLDSDAIGFGGQVLALAEALIDSENGWPKNKKSGSYWATAGETRRLHPLQRPS